MNASIKKEVRQLALPFFATVLLTVTASVVFIGHDGAWLVNDVFAFGCLLIGVTVFGGEFQYRTAASLLAQPVRRQRIWGLKMILLVLALAVSYGVNLLSVQLFIKGEAIPDAFLWYALIALAAPILVLSLVPIATLAMKNYIGAIVVTVGLGFFVSLVFSGNVWLEDRILHGLITALRDSSERHPYWNGIALGTIYLLPCAVFCALMYWLGYRKFMTLEVIEGQGQEVALPVKIEGTLGKVVKSFIPGYSGPTASLIRKELELHRVAFIVSAVTLAVLLCEATVWKINQGELAKGWIVGTYTLFVILIPFVIGTACMADEKSWGVTAWQLTLPPSWRRQALVKLFVTYLVCFLLGVALPFLLHSTGEVILGMKFGSIGWNWAMVAHGYLVAFTLIVFASSISRSVIGAIGVSIGLIIGVGAVAISMFSAVNDLVSAWIEPGDVYTSVENSAVRFGIIYGAIVLFEMAVVLMAVQNFKRTAIGSTGWLRTLFEGVRTVLRPIAITAVLMVIVGILAWNVLRTREPVYRGMSLSEWAARFDRPDSPNAPLNTDDYNTAYSAIQAIGTNAFPYLIKMASAEDRRIRLRGYYGLDALGTAAKPATPLLARALQEPDLIGRASAFALAKTGSDGIAILAKALPNASDYARYNTAEALSVYAEQHQGKMVYRQVMVSDEEFGAAQGKSIQLLLDLTRDSDPQVVDAAVRSLGMIHERSEIVVPRLIELAGKPARDSVQMEIFALGQYREKARAATPLVLKALEDRDELTRKTASNALKAIDRELAAKMGIK